MAKAGKSGTSDQTDSGKTEEKEVKDLSTTEVIDAEIIEDAPAGEDESEQAAPESDRAEDAADVITVDSDGTAEAPDLAPERDPEPEPEPEPETDSQSDGPSIAAADETAPLPSPTMPVVTVEKRSAMPMILGGVVAAALGFGAAQVAGPLLGGDTQQQIAELTGKIDAQAKVIRDLRDTQAKLAETAGAANDAVAALPTLANQVEAMSSDMTDLSATVGGFDDRIATLEKRPMTEALSSEAIAAYEREVAALKDTVAEQLEAARTLKQNSDMSAQEALARAALTRVISAVDSGAPYQAALNDLVAATGQDIPAALADHAADGVPTLAALQDAFPDYAREALAAARAANPEADSGSKLGAFLRNQLGARSVEPREGNDADAILSRAEAALRAGRVTETLAELDTLPEAAAGVIAPWVAEASIRRAATDAVDTLSDSLNKN